MVIEKFKPKRYIQLLRRVKVLFKKKVSEEQNKKI